MFTVPVSPNAEPMTLPVDPNAERRALMLILQRTFIPSATLLFRYLKLADRYLSLETRGEVTVQECRELLDDIGTVRQKRGVRN
jgi:hypothetical protein